MNRFKFAKKFALVFFIIGSTLFLIQIMTSELTAITIFGYYYLILSIIINLIFVILLLCTLVLDKNKKETIKSIGVLMLNIPIAFIYAYLVLNHII